MQLSNDTKTLVCILNFLHRREKGLFLQNREEDEGVSSMLTDRLCAELLLDSGPKISPAITDVLLLFEKFDDLVLFWNYILKFKQMQNLSFSKYFNGRINMNNDF